MCVWKGVPQSKTSSFPAERDEMREQEDARVLKLVRSGLCSSISDCIKKDETSLRQILDEVLKISYALGKTEKK